MDILRIMLGLAMLTFIGFLAFTGATAILVGILYVAFTASAWVLILGSIGTAVLLVILYLESNKE